MKADAILQFAGRLVSAVHKKKKIKKNLRKSKEINL